MSKAAPGVVGPCFVVLDNRMPCQRAVMGRARTARQLGELIVTLVRFKGEISVSIHDEGADE